jgi:hypothetical protein
MKVAPEHPKAHGKGSWKCMKEWFLFDGIQLKSSYVSVRHEQLTGSVESDPANTIEAVENDATVPAGVASQLSVLQGFVEFTLRCERLQNILEG